MKLSRTTTRARAQASLMGNPGHRSVGEECQHYQANTYSTHHPRHPKCQMEAAAQHGPERKLHLWETPATVRWGRSVNTTKQTPTPPITPPSPLYPTHPTLFTFHRYTLCTSPPPLPFIFNHYIPPAPPPSLSTATVHSPHLTHSAPLPLTHLTLTPPSPLPTPQPP